jgi:hypothetical protein
LLGVDVMDADLLSDMEPTAEAVSARHVDGDVRLPIEQIRRLCAAEARHQRACDSAGATQRPFPQSNSRNLP